MQAYQAITDGVVNVAQEINNALPYDVNHPDQNGLLHSTDWSAQPNENLVSNSTINWVPLVIGLSAGLSTLILGLVVIGFCLNKYIIQASAKSDYTEHRVRNPGAAPAAGTESLGSQTIYLTTESESTVRTWEKSKEEKLNEKTPLTQDIVGSNPYVSGEGEDGGSDRV
jgi:hypothetical protein